MVCIDSTLNRDERSCKEFQNRLRDFRVAHVTLDDDFSLLYKATLETPWIPTRGGSVAGCELRMEPGGL